MWQLILLQCSILLIAVQSTPTSYMDQKILLRQERDTQIDCALCDISYQPPEECWSICSLKAPLGKRGFSSGVQPMCMCCLHSRMTNSDCCRQCYSLKRQYWVEPSN